MVLDLLAVGLDPDRCALIRQSDLPEHAELAWIFNTCVPVPWAERNPTYKEAREEGKENSLGLLDYPILQAADIVIYKASRVPVGKDQAAHLELSREVVRAFNRRYGEIFPEPQPVYTDAPVVLGTDGARKMGKSAGNTIPIFAEPDEIRRLVMSMVTDPLRIKRTDPGARKSATSASCIGSSATTTSRSRTASAPRGPAASTPSSCWRSASSSTSGRCARSETGSPPIRAWSRTRWRPEPPRCGRSSTPPCGTCARPSASAPARRPDVTGPVAGLGPRERRWLVIFLALGSAYFGFLLAERVLGFIGGFATILLILFLAWLLAFVMSPVVAALERQLNLPQAGGRDRRLRRRRWWCSGSSCSTRAPR